MADLVRRTPPQRGTNDAVSLDLELCLRALGTRDRRFDGRFFIAVRTTGIYCRPICPARTPRPENVTFFATPAAAEEAGYRACRRCRPETAPASPAWQGTSATVTRALRLLGTESRVDRLADRLGVGERHLRRLFAEHLGASPRSVLMSQRVHFARRLLDETDLPLEDLAHAAGFGSARRLRAAVTRTFGRSPDAIRHAARHAKSRARASGEAPLTLKLPHASPYDFQGMLAYRKARAIPGVETVEGGVYRRSVATSAGAGVIEIAQARDALTLSVWLPGTPDLFPLVERVRRMLDLDADALAIGAHLAKDRALASYVSKRPGLRVPAAWDPFELAVRAILGQQVSVAAATTLSGRLVERFGTAHPVGEKHGVPRLFPGAATIAAAGENGLAKLGMPGARARGLAAFARAVAEGTVSLAPAADLESAIGAMCAVRGIGPWTAHYVALRGLGEPDAFPASDLGLRKALAPKGGKPLSEAELLKRAEGWRPWRGYAAIHLWSSLA
jgi:AraC family transcriptional regulator of adaptative response / DNA-3-methyladenine glycosylase II